MRRMMPFGLAALTLFMVGCGANEESDKGKKGAEARSTLSDSYWLAAPPEGAKDIKELRRGAKAGDTVVAVGRIKDFTDRRAQFQLTDLSLVPCNEREGDTCKTPWDYCCESVETRVQSTVVVEFRDGDELRTEGLAGFHGFDRLKKAYVRGKVVRDEAGNVVIVAAGLHVAP